MKSSTRLRLAGRSASLRGESIAPHERFAMEYLLLYDGEGGVRAGAPSRAILALTAETRVLPEAAGWALELQLPPGCRFAGLPVVTVDGRDVTRRFAADAGPIEGRVTLSCADAGWLLGRKTMIRFDALPGGSAPYDAPLWARLVFGMREVGKAYYLITGQSFS